LLKGDAVSIGLDFPLRGGVVYGATQLGKAWEALPGPTLSFGYLLGKCFPLKPKGFNLPSMKLSIFFIWLFILFAFSFKASNPFIHWVFFFFFLL
jgi:hypothetical protein